MESSDHVVEEGGEGRSEGFEVLDSERVAVDRGVERIPTWVILGLRDHERDQSVLVGENRGSAGDVADELGVVLRLRGSESGFNDPFERISKDLIEAERRKIRIERESLGRRGGHVGYLL